MDEKRLLRIYEKCSALVSEVRTDADLHYFVSEGLPVEVLWVLTEQEILTEAELCEFITPRTLARRKHGQRLTPEESDLVFRIARLFDYANDVFGSFQKAHEWFRKPNRALDGNTPIEFLRTEFGSRLVESILGRIEHGVYS